MLDFLGKANTSIHGVGEFAVYTVFYPVIMPADPCYVLILVLHSLYICILIYFR